MEFKYLIIGGGVAGTTAAETIRSKDPEGSIAIVSDEPYRLYSRVMLSKKNWFTGKVPFEQIWLKTETWYEEKNITLLEGKLATKLNSEKKIVTLDDTQEVSYEKLLLATGGRARMWPTEGADKKGVHYCRTMNEGKGILEHSKTAKKAVIIGSGFISFEMAELFKLAGIDVTIVMREEWYWQPLLEKEGAEIVEKAVNDFGVKIIRQAEVEKVLGGDTVEGVLLKNGEQLECDIIVCGIGIIFDNAWLEGSGVELNRGILANDCLETNVPDIWTAGDIAEYDDCILEERIQMCNWANAREHGRVAGLGMAGERTQYKFVSFYNAQGMEMNIAFVGDIRGGGDKTIIQRNDPSVNSYVQLIVLDDELVGGTLINKAPEVGAVSNLVKNNIKVDQKLAELADPNFDLKSLLQ